MATINSDALAFWQPAANLQATMYKSVDFQGVTPLFSPGGALVAVTVNRGGMLVCTISKDCIGTEYILWNGARLFSLIKGFDDVSKQLGNGLYNKISSFSPDLSEVLLQGEKGVVAFSVENGLPIDVLANEIGLAAEVRFLANANGEPQFELFEDNDVIERPSTRGPNPPSGNV